MAKLLKLSICGIRSFGPYEEDIQNITFSSPVTLILGENGCGKTTIIECLKFACTGELPSGSNSGQGFVNDPKLNSSTSTKGRVKLKITDSKENTVVIFKAVRVEQKSFISQKFSTLDSTITVKKPNGEVLPLSSRCADIGIQACSFMGISKAILNNVIFCHQENSSWPLEEAKKLKEKFDEIFDATRYNTCIDTTRKMMKTEVVSLKLQKETLVYKKEKKENVERDKAKLQEKQEKLDNLIQDITKNKKEMEPISARIESICDIENNFVELQKKCASKESEKTNIEDQQKNICEKLGKEFEGSDCDLEQVIATFEENYTKSDEQIEEMCKMKQKIEREEQNRSVEIQKTQVRLGQLQEEKKQQDKAIADRNTSILDMAPEIYSRADLDDNKAVKDVIKSLNDVVNQSKTSMDSLYDNFQHEEKSLQDNIDVCLQNTIKVQQQIQLNKEQISEIRKKNRDTNSQLKRLDISDEELKRYNNRIANIEKDLQALVENFDSDSISSKIEKSKQKIRIGEENLEVLEEEYKLLQKNYIIENEIETRTHDIMKRENDIDEFKNDHFDEFRELFKEVPDKDFKAVIEKCRQNSKDKVSNLSKTLEVKKKDTTTLETNIQFQEEKLQIFKQELQKSEKKISVICEGKSFDAACSEVEHNIEKLQKSRGQLSSAKIMYEKFVKDFRKQKPCCPVCETDFNNKEGAVNRIIMKIESQIHGIPTELKKVEEELKKKQDFFNQIQQTKPMHARVEELKNVLIPDLTKDIDNNTVKLKLAERDLKKLNIDIVEPQKKLELSSKLIGDAVLIDQFLVEVERFKQNVSDLKSQLIKVNTDKSREQVESNVSMLKIHITELRQTCDTDQKKLDRNKDKCQDLREQKNKIIEKRLQLHKIMQGKPQLQDQIRELLQKEKSVENEIRELQLQLEPLEDKLEATKISLIETKANNKNLIDKERLKHNELEKKVENIQKLQVSIENSYKKDIEGQFTSAVEKFETNQTEMKGLSMRKDQISEKITNLKRQQASRDFEKRKLDDNLDLRKKRKQVALLINEINDLNKQIGKFNFRTLQNEKNQLRAQYVGLQGDIDKKDGQKDELEASINDLGNELNKPENKNAYKTYMHKLYEYEITKKTVNDLKLFIEGVENAIIDFHKEKMSKINKAIRELWRSIYRGNDIDNIQIKTEESSTTAKRRLYNYKVVQIKNDIELEMRGRCSAGQKVLACLIIRMALSETFSHNCGILALDEPTTNLDKENIVSLSEALARMIHTRRSEKNFQLLVITHDEDFVRALSSTERINECIRVKRNNKGNTIVIHEDI